MRDKTLDRYETDPVRATMALVLGAVFGLVVSVALEVGPLAVSAYASGTAGLLWVPIPGQIEISLQFAAPFAAAFSAISALLWWICGRFVQPGWLGAAALGFAVVFTGWFLIGLPEGPGVWQGVGASLFGVPEFGPAASILFGMVGALSGLITWRIAHRRKSPTSQVSPLTRSDLAGNSRVMVRRRGPGRDRQ